MLRDVSSSERVLLALLAAAMTLGAIELIRREVSLHGPAVADGFG
jgi:hypothetical protein